MSEAISFERSPELLDTASSALLVVDMQDKLLNLIDGGETLIWNCRRLIDGASLLDVPVGVTEQYPEGLGPTNPELIERLPDPYSKRAFSCCEVSELFESWVAKGIHKIVVCGIESHVCVLQTTMDLIAAGFSIYLCVDACGSRHAQDYEVALRRMDVHGVTLTTVETTLFEWCGTSTAPQFKQISGLVREPRPNSKGN